VVPVVVVSDTTCCLPGAVVVADGLRLVSLYVNWGAERPEAPAFVSEIGPVLGVHTGLGVHTRPGVLALAAVPSRLLA
jgi:fatty acid-binding protein DegV